MKAKLQILSWASLLFLSSVYSGCPPREKLVFNVTATYQRKTNPPNTNETQTISFLDTASLTARRDDMSGRISDIDVTMTKASGTLPPLTAAISMTYFRTATDLLAGNNGFAGNTGWLATHTGELATCTESVWLEHAPSEFGYNNTDSAINITQVDELGASLHPVYREAGATYLARFSDADQYIPWTHPEVPAGAVTLANVNSDSMHLDMRSLTRLLFATMSAAVTAAVTGMPPITWTLPSGVTIPVLRAVLGGPGRTGVFRLHFVPQLQSNENGSVGDTMNQVMPRPGVAFYFEATIDAVDAPTGQFTAAIIRVVIPAFLMFDRTDVSGDFQVELQPITDLTNGLAGSSTGLDKIIVLANTPLGIESTNTANRIRAAVIAGLTATAAGPGGLGVFIASTIAFSTGFNKYKKNKELAEIEFDVITIPNNCMRPDSPLCFRYKGMVPTQVQPETAGSTAISVFVLNRYR